MRDYLGHWHELDESDLAPQFATVYETGQRVEVTNAEHDWIRRGYVGKTMGWKPAYILLNNTRSRGSSDVLGKDDKIVKWLPKFRS